MWLYKGVSGGGEWGENRTPSLDRRTRVYASWRYARGVAFRSVQLIGFMQHLQSRQIGFQSLVEAIDTTTATGQFFFQITGAFAELERNLIRERTLAGLASARCRGRYGGRPRAIDPDTFAMALQLYQAQAGSVQSICSRLGIARRTFYRYVATQRAQQQRGG
jgi:DNA invertase Pin-like site-specific DNA recombinase